MLKVRLNCPICGELILAKSLEGHLEKVHELTGVVRLRLNPTSPYSHELEAIEPVAPDKAEEAAAEAARAKEEAEAEAKAKEEAEAEAKEEAEAEAKAKEEAEAEAKAKEEAEAEAKAKEEAEARAKEE